MIELDRDEFCSNPIVSGHLTQNSVLSQESATQAGKANVIDGVQSKGAFAREPAMRRLSRTHFRDSTE